MEHWACWRDADIGGSETAKESVFVEMNSDTGRFQIWLERKLFS